MFDFDINFDWNLSINFRNKLTHARTEMGSIISELQLIESGLRTEFNGIGQDMCANAIQTVATHYQIEVLSRLNNMENNWPVQVITEIFNN